MRKFVALATIAALLWMPLPVHTESMPVDQQSPLTGTPTSSDSLAAADTLFSYGEDKEHDRQALATLERAVATDATNYQLLWRAARAFYQVGNDVSASE